MKERILFVDDELEVLDGLQRSLRKLRDRWEMEFASSGEEALIAIMERPFDVVVTDLRMPKMDGMALLREIERGRPQIGRVILSGVLDRDTVTHGRKLVQDYLVKPCNSELLSAVIQLRLSSARLIRSRENPQTAPIPPVGLTSLNLNQAIETAVTAARLEWLDVASVETDLDPSLPAVPCREAEIRMVIVTMIVGAAHSVAQAGGPGGPKGAIRIRTRRQGSTVELQLVDPVTRIPPEARAKVFDPTYEGELGPGAWLPVAHEVARQHQGALALESLPDRGTSFAITLPV